MLSSSPHNSTEIVTQFSSIYTVSYCEFASAVLFIYDFIITIGDESEYFWRNTFTGPAALFHLNRSLAMVNSVLEILFHIAPLDSVSCATLAKLVSVLQILQCFPLGVFTALRIFAISQSWTLAVPIFVLGVFPTVGANFALFGFRLTGAELPGISGCILSDALSIELGKKLVIVSRTCLITADCLAILVTWLKLPNRITSIDLDKDTTPGYCGLKKKNTLAHVLLRDGTIYFVVIGVLNCIQLTFTLLSFQVASLQNTAYIGYFTEPLTVILVSRFLLHLQSAKYKTFGVGSLVSQTASLTRFECRVIGSLDATLSPEDFLETPDSDTIDPATTPEVSE